MTRVANGAEGGTTGTTVTTGNSGGASGTAFNTVTIGASSTLTFDDAHAAHGGLALKFVSTGNQCLVRWTSGSHGSLTEEWGRFYIWRSANPTAITRVVEFRNAALTVIGAIIIGTNGKLGAIDSAGASIAGMTSTNTIVGSAWVRVEYHVIFSATVGFVEYKIFFTPDSTTPSDTKTSAATLNMGLECSAVVFGVAGNTNSGTEWLDDIVAGATAYPGPSGFPAGQASETDTAQAIARAKQKSIGQPSVTNTAQAVTRLKSRIAGQASETDLGQALTVTRNVAVGQPSETDLAQAAARGKQKLTGAATESDLAQALTTRRSLAIGQASEVDQAQIVATARSRAIGQAAETDTSRIIGESRSRAASQAPEAGAAQAVSSRKSRAVGQATEIDEAIAGTIANVPHFVAVAQVTETDAAQTFGSRKSREFRQAEELDAILASFTNSKSLTVFRTVDRSFPQAIRAAHSRVLGRATETGTASAVTSRHSRTLGRVSEADQPGAVAAGKRKALGQAAEVDSTASVRPQHSRIVGRATEAESAGVLGRRKVRGTGQAASTELARRIHRKGRTMVLGEPSTSWSGDDLEDGWDADPTDEWSTEVMAGWGAGPPRKGWGAG